MSIVAKKIMMGSGAVALPSDDEFNRVSFLSHFDGANNGVNNAFDDGSASNHTITANGNVTQGSFGPFARPDGEWGVDFDGGGTHHCAADADFAFGTGDFCMEAWVFVDADDYNFSRVLSFGPVYGTGDSHGITVDHTDYSHKTRYYDSSSNFFLYSSAATPRNIWFHVAVTKASNTVRLFINGTVEASGTNTNPPEDSSTNTVAIGNARPAEVGTGADFQGFISNARVVKGSAVYTSDFTPPTAPLTAITNTKLLTCQSNRFVDNSAEAHAILIGGAAGAVQVSAFGPFLTSAVYKPAVNGASAYFDGSGDDLVAADSSDFELGSGDFTISMWMYPDSISPTSTVEALISHASHSGGVGWAMWWQTNSGLNRLRFFVNGTARQYETNIDFTGNQWTYVTAVRTGNTLKLFVNGVEGLSTSFADFNNSTTTLTIGSSTNWNSNYPFSGYLSDVRVVKGTAVYTSNFTPPTAPLTAVTNTKLLLNMADGQAIDSAAQNNLTLAGNAKLSTGQAKFGNTSMVFDGTGDYAFAPHNSIYNLSGDFTVELWAYISSNNTTSLIGKWAGSNYAWIVQDLVTSLRFYTGNSGSIGTGYSFSWSRNLNQWYHIAITRSGTTIRAFQDGVLLGTGTNSDNLSSSDSLNIGYNKDGSIQHFNGYLDDVRITNGLARYTANFTAPAEPFADKGQ